MAGFSPPDSVEGAKDAIHKERRFRDLLFTSSKESDTPKEQRNGKTPLSTKVVEIEIIIRAYRSDYDCWQS
jgi:hypothetical protein